MIKYGFELLEEREIPEINTVAKRYRHVKTGAGLLSLENDDENKVFGITFRTPPPDSTGLPHIMEHSVLCGSRKYPVKEPFVELMKGSLNTFLNAMTFSDKTSYPVASTNLQDFYNLIDVYLDAVFYPRLTPEILQQEGWHYELDDLDAPLTYKGVVFNEMKGAYASPDSLIARYSEQSLFPDNAYGFDSGGNPEEIPSLTYEQFKAFHETYYHPSNARIFMYGDDDPEERLRLLNEYLGDYGYLPVESAIDLQPRLEEQRRVVRPYPAGEEQAPKAMITVNWLLPENTDPTETLALGILSHSLVETPASPLRKALIDSGLGEDVIGGGLDTSVRQLYFSTGLKGVDPANVDRVEALILETLEELAEKGVDRETVEASLNTIEFRLREQNTGRFPRGLFLMIRALTTWLHDGDPLAPIAFEAPLQKVKRHLGKDEGYFSELIRRHLVTNPHRTTVILEPDPTLQEQQEAAEKARLAAAKTAMTEREQLQVIEQANRLREMQETPDPPELLATIPSLKLEDLDPEPTLVPTVESTMHGTRVLTHDLFTNGIIYLDVGFDLHALPKELLPYTALFTAALLELGTETEDFVKLTQRIGRHTGGIQPTTFTSTVRTSGATAAWAILRSKATIDKVDELLAILRDVLLTVRLDNKPRFVQMLLEKKAQEEASIIPMGHRVVASRLRAKYSAAHWVAEQISGVDYLFFLRRLAEEVEQDWPAVLKKLETVRRLLVNRSTMLCNITLDAENLKSAEPKIADFLAALPATEIDEATWSPSLNPNPEGLTIPAQVNYVGKGANLFELGYKRDGSIEVISHYLRSTWLWERIRVQGGAYGAFCVFDAHTGAYGYLSYRDPNLVQTLDVYDQTATFLKDLTLAEDELVKSIIGAIGNIDAYQLPDAKGYSAMQRHLIDYSDDARRRYRTQVLETTADDFRAFAEFAEEVAETGTIVVLGSSAAIQAAEADRGLGLEITPINAAGKAT
ncbi:MAG: insulinase family protein [Anaerolineae bacterium]